MSADRELLEFAAKAAGIRLNISDGAGDERYLWITDAVTGKNWDPLTDDGDALRLAVKLRLSTGYAGVPTIHAVWAGNGVVDAVEPFEGAQSLRKAIVRAAAEIGKAMP